LKKTMPAIDPRQWRPLFDAVYEMNTAKDHADFLSAVVVGMSRLIPADQTVMHMLDRKTQRMVFRILPDCRYTQAELDYYAAHPGGDPLVAHFEKTGDPQARRTSDVISTRDYVKTPHFIHCQQRLGFVHTLALPVKINADTIGALSFDRSKSNFTKRHCALLDAFAPHFILAWNRHIDPWTAPPEPAEPVRMRFQKLGLTVREADVLFWMTEGKQNPEIAIILGLSLGTVQEHVGNLVRKLGQENRHAATVHALRSLA
jgi:DNA-binding CsgD family transcriptional regulator